MKAGARVVERVEEYRYHSGSIGEAHGLRITNLAVRLQAFYKVHKRANKLPPKRKKR